MLCPRSHSHSCSCCFVDSTCHQPVMAASSLQELAAMRNLAICELDKRRHLVTDVRISKRHMASSISLCHQVSARCRFVYAHTFLAFLSHSVHICFVSTSELWYQSSGICFNYVLCPRSHSHSCSCCFVDSTCHQPVMVASSLQELAAMRNLAICELDKRRHLVTDVRISKRHMALLLLLMLLLLLLFSFSLSFSFSFLFLLLC